MRVLKLSHLSRCLLVALTGCALSLARADETPPPSVTITPTATTVNAGTNFTFTANVSGATAVGYQWSRVLAGTNSPIDGATNRTLNFTNVLSSDHGLYTVVVGTAANGSLMPLQQATLDVNGVPVLDSVPANQTKYIGQNAPFTAVVYSTTPTTNGWYFNSVPLTNAVFYDITNGYRSEHSITLTNLAATNAGVYTFAATNASGVTSWSALLTVLALPDPALRFGPERILGGQYQFPIYYTAHSGETNLTFSVAYDPAVFTNADFTPKTSVTVQGGGTTQIITPITFPPVVGNRNRPKPAALPDGTNVLVQTTGTPGFLGVSLTLTNNFVFEPGEDPDSLGTLTFDLVAGQTNPYAGLVTFTNTPVPLTFSPFVISTNATNSVVTTNSTIAISPAPPSLVSSNFVSTATGPKLNLQTGNFEQIVQYANPGAATIDNVFLVIGSLGTDSNTNAIRHQNAHGYLTTGESFVSLPSLKPGETNTAVLEYFAPDHQTVYAPTLKAYGTSAITNTLANTTPVNITTNRFVDNGLLRGFLVEFLTQTNFHYYVQYADHAEDFATTNRVRTALPAVLGTGSKVQWLDNGPPKTDSLPTNGGRFYHVLETR
jgi:hypothetical protein